MQDGETPLHRAASCGDSSTAKVLLEAGAEVMARDEVSSCVSIARDLSEVWKAFVLLCKITFFHSSVYYVRRS